MTLGAKKARPRSLFKFSLITVLALAAIAFGWSVFWNIASGKTAAVLDVWVEHERAVGRVWTCPDRKVGGYPFAIDITCSMPHVEGEFAGRHIDGSLEGVVVSAALYRPGRIHADLRSPLTLRSVDVNSPLPLHGPDGSAAFTVRWDALRVDISGLPYAVGRIAADGDQVAVQGTISGVGAIAAHAATFQGRARKVKTRQDGAYDFRVAAVDASVPALDTLLGGATPALVDIAGTMTHADFSSPGTLTQRIDQWRRDGGRIDLSEAVVTRGSAKFDARGTLSLDSTHRLQGHLDAQFAGLEPILLRLGVNPGVVNAGTLLGHLFGGGRHDGGKDSGKAAGSGLRLPVALDKGVVSIGPVRTSLRLSPLY